MLLLPEGQTGEGWGPFQKKNSFGNMGACFHFSSFLHLEWESFDQIL
jgi:hypothetical protein